MELKKSRVSSDEAKSYEYNFISSYVLYAIAMSSVQVSVNVAVWSLVMSGQAVTCNSKFNLLPLPIHLSHHANTMPPSAHP